MKIEDLKIGLKIGQFKIIEEMYFKVYRIHFGKCKIYKTKCLECGKIFYFTDQDLLKHNFNNICTHFDRNYYKATYDKAKWILNQKIGRLFIKDLCPIYTFFEKVKSSNVLYVVTDCDCGNKNQAFRYTLVKRAYENNKNISCGCVSQETILRNRAAKFDIGTIKNGWEIIRKDRLGRNNKWYYKCRCTCCGEEKIFYHSNMMMYDNLCKRRKQKLFEEIQEKRKQLIQIDIPNELYNFKSFKNLIGQKKGKLTVIGFSFYLFNGKSIDYRYWLCKCDCGNLTCLSEKNFTEGVVSSCGCAVKDARQKSIIYTNKNFKGKKFGRLEILEVLRDKNNIPYFKCKCKCGNIIETRASSVVCGHTSSCGCLNSKGEEKITSILLKEDISFEIQKTFKDCKDKNNLRFDFAVYNKNNKDKFCLIEYNGQQHYSAYSFGSHEIEDQKKENFKNTQRRDKIKIEYCKNNNIPLLIIPYWNFRKMKDIMINFFKENGII